LDLARRPGTDQRAPEDPGRQDCGSRTSRPRRGDRSLRDRGGARSLQAARARRTRRRCGYAISRPELDLQRETSVPRLTKVFWPSPAPRAVVFVARFADTRGIPGGGDDGCAFTLS